LKHQRRKKFAFLFKHGLYRPYRHNGRKTGQLRLNHVGDIYSVYVVRTYATFSHGAISSVRSNTPNDPPFGQAIYTTGPNGHQQLNDDTY